jgi:hypothetical protein
MGYLFWKYRKRKWVVSVASILQAMFTLRVELHRALTAILVQMVIKIFMAVGYQMLIWQSSIVWEYFSGALIMGGAGEDVAVSCRTDLIGNVCMVGITTSSNNIASGPFGGFDAFIAKFNSAGIRLWANFYGGPQSDYGSSCSIDGSG